MLAGVVRGAVPGVGSDLDRCVAEGSGPRLTAVPVHLKHLPSAEHSVAPRVASRRDEATGRQSFNGSARGGERDGEGVPRCSWFQELRLQQRCLDHLLRDELRGAHQSADPTVLSRSRMPAALVDRLVYTDNRRRSPLNAHFSVRADDALLTASR